MSRLYYDYLSNHTTFKIGGKAKIFEPKNVKELQDFVVNNKNYFVLGNGSNILCGNHIKVNIIKTTNLDNIYKIGNVVCVESGVSLFKLIGYCIKNGLSGLEPLYGIPGTIGGAVYMNAGSFGVEIGDFVTSIDYIDNMGKKHKKIKPKFSYRKSFFTGRSCVITMVRLKLRKACSDCIALRCRSFLLKKKSAQPYELPSAGSVFKRQNDIVAPILIEKCGLKGLKIGGAMVSNKHCGFIVNLGNAKFIDVKKIICKIQKTVFKKFGIILTREIVVIGEKDGVIW